MAACLALCYGHSSAGFPTTYQGGWDAGPGTQMGERDSDGSNLPIFIQQRALNSSFWTANPLYSSRWVLGKKTPFGAWLLSCTPAAIQHPHVIFPLSKTAEVVQPQNCSLFQA